MDDLGPSYTLTDGQIGVLAILDWIYTAAYHSTDKVRLHRKPRAGIHLADRIASLLTT